MKINRYFVEITRVIEQILGIGMETFQNGIFFQGDSKIFEKNSN